MVLNGARANGSLDEGVPRTIQLGSHRVRVWVRGSGNGPPLLLLNGLGSPLELWEPLLRSLKTRSIAFDTPGSGESSTPALPLSIGGHARLALALLDELGEHGADVLGFSFGGLVAQELARLAPIRIERLVLSSTSCGWGGVLGSPSALAASMTPARDYPSARGHLYQAWAAAMWSSFYWLPELTQPTLVLASDADDLVPASNADMLVDMLPNARKHIVAGGGHLCLLEQAQQLGPLIEGFLSRDARADPIVGSDGDVTFLL